MKRENNYNYRDLLLGKSIVIAGIIAFLFAILNRPILVSIVAIFIRREKAPYISQFLTFINGVEIISSLIYLILATLGFLYVFILPPIVFLYRQGWKFNSVQNITFLISLGFVIISPILFWLGLFNIPFNQFTIILIPLILCLIFLNLPKLTFIPQKLYERERKRTVYYYPMLTGIVILGILIFFLRLYVFAVQNQAWSDARIHVRQVKQFVAGEFFRLDTEPWAPYYQAISSVLFSFVGNEFIALKALTFISSFLIPLYCVTIFRQIDKSSPDCVSLITGALTLLYPLANALSTIALLDTLVTLIFLIIIQIFLTLKNVLINSNDHKEIRQLGFLSFMLAIALTITTLIRFSFGILIIAFTVVIIFFVYKYKRYKIHFFISYAIGGIIMGIPWLIRNFIYHGSLFYTRDWMLFSINYFNERVYEVWEYYVLSDVYIGLPIIIFLIAIFLFGIFDPNFIKREQLKDIGWTISITVLSLVPFLFYVHLQIRLFLSAFILIPIFLSLALKDEKTMIPPLLTGLPYFYYTFSELSSYWFILCSIDPLSTLPNPEKAISWVFLVITLLCFSFIIVLMVYIDRTKDMFKKWFKFIFKNHPTKKL